MDKKLLLDIINNGIDEIKEITKDFQTNNPTVSEVNISITKTEIILKELELLNKIVRKEDVTTAPLKSEVVIDHKQELKEEKKEELIVEKKVTEDIRNLIGINDKFLFIRELFKGDTKEYSETIERINNTNSLIDAQQIVSSHNWDIEEESTKLFFEILNRKYI